MATIRSYSEACSAAHALDLIGERWALLVVRELLLGPKRFTDLRAGLLHASPNVLSQRLRELEEAGVLRRRKLPPPAGSWVYELTEWGQELEPVLVQLARWGSRSPARDLTARSSIDALMLAMRSNFDPESSTGLDISVALRIGEQDFAVRIANRQITIVRGEASGADAAISADPATFAAVMMRRRSLDEAIAGGQLTVTGERKAMEQLLRTLAAPSQVSSQPARHA